MPTKKENLESKSVTFSFDDGKDDIVIDLNDLSPEIVTHLALHGIKQKGGDSYAGAKTASEKLGVDPLEWARAQVEGVRKQLLEGDWTVRQPGGLTSSDLAVALAEATGCEISEAVEKLADTDKDTKKDLRAHPAIKAVLERLRAERAAAKAEKAAAAADSGPDLGEAFGL